MPERKYEGFAVFSSVFTLFAVLVTIGHGFAQTAPSLELGRVAASILVCAALAAPALVLLARGPVGADHPGRARWWWMLWLHALLAYVIHVIAAIAFFDWSPRTAWVRQGTFISLGNYLLLVLWTASVIVGRRATPRASWLHVVVSVLFVTQFAYAALFIRPESRSTLAQGLAVAVVVGPAIALVARFMMPLPREEPAPAA